MKPFELSTTLSLRQRIARNEDPRTIALAIRTFKRAGINKAALCSQFSAEKWILIEPIVDDLILISQAASFDKSNFMDKANSLLTLLESAES